MMINKETGESRESIYKSNVHESLTTLAFLQDDMERRHKQKNPNGIEL